MATWAALKAVDEPTLGVAVTVDVALGYFDGFMTSKKLDVAQRGSRSVGVAGGVGDESSAS